MKSSQDRGKAPVQVANLIIVIFDADDPVDASVTADCYVDFLAETSNAIGQTGSKEQQGHAGDQKQNQTDLQQTGEGALLQGQDLLGGLNF